MVMTMPGLLSRYSACSSAYFQLLVLAFIVCASGDDDGEYELVWFVSFDKKNNCCHILQITLLNTPITFVYSNILIMVHL